MFFRLSAEVNRILSPITFITALDIAAFTIMIAFQLSLVSATQPESHISLWRLSSLHIIIIISKPVSQNYLLTYSMEKISSWGAKRYQVVKKFPAFCGTQKFNTAFTGIATCPYPQPDQSTTWSESHFRKNRKIRKINIRLTSTAGSSKLSLSLRFPTKTLYTPLLSPYLLHAPSISFFSI